MRRSSFATASIATAALGLGLSFAAPAPANAALLTFTWNPSVTGNTTAGQFTSNKFLITDWASIHVPANPGVPGAVHEQGFLEITEFDFNGHLAISPVHTVGPGGYGIYEAFTATSHLAPCATGLCGAFDSITADVFLYSTKHGVASYSFNAANNPVIHLPAGANKVKIATESGPIASSPNFANITDGVPGASVDVNFTPNPAFAGMFVSPPASFVLDLDQVFTNTVGTVRAVGPGCPGTNCTFEIQGGGGNANFLTTAIPEPAAIAVFGLGLTVLGLARRRRT